MLLNVRGFMTQQLITEKLGIDINSISKEAMNVWKMVFEQILLLAIHARQLYGVKDNVNYHQRLKLIHILDNLSRKNSFSAAAQDDMRNKFTDILLMINNNSGTNDIVKYLQEQTDEISWKTTNGENNNKQNILEKIEQQLVVFRRWENDDEFLKRKIYHYYPLYKILKDPIMIFQSLLSFPMPDNNYIENLVIGQLIETIDENKHWLSDFAEVLQDSKDSSEDPYKYIMDNIKFFKLEDEKKKKALAKSTISTVKNNLAKHMSIWADYVFSQVSQPFFNKDNHPFIIFENDYNQSYDDLKPKTFFEGICEVGIIQDKITVSIDKMGFADVVSMNLLPELSEQILSGLKNMDFQNPHQLKFSLDKKVEVLEAFNMLSKWYDSHKTKVFTSYTQIPKLIVAILDFDASHLMGLFNAELNQSNHQAFLGRSNMIGKSVKVNERHYIITLIVSACLYDNELSVSDVITQNHKSLQIYLEKIASVVPSKILPKLKNGFMVDWTIFESKKINTSEDKIEVKEESNQVKNESAIQTESKEKDTLITDRFKKLPNFLHPTKRAGATTVYEQIIDQKSLKSNSPTYPLNSGFPLPLWVNNF